MYRCIASINVIDQYITSIDAIDLLHRLIHRSKYDRSDAIDLLYPTDLLIDKIH